MIFIGTWMAGAEWSVDGSRLCLERHGRPKLADRVDEITLNGARGLADGKQVYYVTSVGVFRLTGDGLEMIRRMPGVDAARDVLAHSGARLVVPDDVPEVDAPVVTEKKFRLGWPDS